MEDNYFFFCDLMHQINQSLLKCVFLNFQLATTECIQSRINNTLAMYSCVSTVLISSSTLFPLTPSRDNCIDPGYYGRVTKEVCSPQQWHYDWFNVCGHAQKKKDKSLTVV